MGVGDWDAGISQQLAGALELCLIGTTLRFEGEGGRRDRLELPPSGGVVGRHPLAAARLPREAAAISRKHLAFAPLGVGWHAWDCESSHGTTVTSLDGSRRRLVPWVPVPVSHHQRFELASTLTLDVRVYSGDAEGTATAGGHTAALIADPELEIAARALVASRRENPANRQVPAVAELAGTLFCSTGTVYNRLRELWEQPAIVKRLGSLGAQRLDRLALADALISAYPYLLLDVPKPP
jgi:hypothetical protein